MSRRCAIRIKRSIFRSLVGFFVLKFYDTGNRETDRCSGRREYMRGRGKVKQSKKNKTINSLFINKSNRIQQPYLGMRTMSTRARTRNATTISPRSVLNATGRRSACPAEEYEKRPRQKRRRNNSAGSRAWPFGRPAGRPSGESRNTAARRVRRARARGANRRRQTSSWHP